MCYDKYLSLEMEEQDTDTTVDSSSREQVVRGINRLILLKK